jgi:hypothetical protein
MMNADRPFNTFHATAQRAGATWSTIQRQPSWVSRAALLCFVALVALPVILLVLLAFAAAFVLFAILAGVNVVLNAFRGVLPRSDGRENVRVIQRRGDPPPH